MWQEMNGGTMGWQQVSSYRKGSFEENTLSPRGGKICLSSKGGQESRKSFVASQLDGVSSGLDQGALASLERD